MPTIKEIINGLLDEIKVILKEYTRKMENAVKKRLQRLLITGIIVGILLALVIAFVGSASIFLLIGSLKYLSTFMPEWKAWDIMALISGIIAGLLFLVIILIIRKQLRTK